MAIRLMSASMSSATGEERGEPAGLAIQQEANPIPDSFVIPFGKHYQKKIETAVQHLGART